MTASRLCPMSWFRKSDGKSRPITSADADESFSASSRKASFASQTIRSVVSNSDGSGSTAKRLRYMVLSTSESSEVRRRSESTGGEDEGEPPSPTELADGGV